MNYQDFQLNRRRLDLISKHLAKKKVQKYIEDNGVEPTPEIELGFYEISQAEEEKYRKIFFANDFVEESENCIVMPAIIENTPAQNEVESTIVETLISGNKNVTAESINNITIPQEVTVLANITGDFQNGATVESNSTKSMTINNTSDEPIDMNILANGGGGVYLTGQFDDVYFNGRNLYGTSGNYAEINGELDVVPPTTGTVNVSASFQDDSTVRYLGNEDMNVLHYNNEDANLEVYAPNSTVTISGKYDNVETTVSDDTLILKYSFHANTLKVNNGKIIYQGTDPNDFYNTLIGDNLDVNPYGFGAVASNYTRLTSTPGVYTFAEDFTGTSALSFGVVASGKYRYDLNGHDVAFGNSRTASIYVRGTVTLDIVGNGSITNNADTYGIWVTSNDATVNIYGGDFRAYTHVVYAQNGTVNIYGGSFNCLSEDKTFTINCYDASYTAGTASITVYGGKFYNFNPAQSMSEPGGPVSFLAEGYTVRSYQEGNDTVYEVIPQE